MSQITYEEFEEKVHNIVKDYGGFEEEINEFLFDSGNLYSIFETARAVNSEEG